MQINKKYGYIRVSSKSQESNSSIKYKKEQLIQNGIQPENIRIEVGSATNEIKNRLVFQKLIQEELKSNDLLMVPKIDRCSRNTLKFLKLQDILFKKNITFVALDLPTSIDLATNKLIATTLSGIAEFENNRRKERQKQGIRAAQKEGKYTGRKSIINKTLIQKVKNLKENKNLSVTEIAKVLGISRPTIYKILKQELNYVPYNRLVKATKGETNESTFESENLVVDWIGFNIQGLLDRKQVKQIAKYLFQNFGFNSTFAVRSDGKEEILFNDSKNKDQVFFKIYKYSNIYWDGIKIDFSGHNGHQFYKVIVANQVNWKVFNHQKDIRLSRLDLCYSCKKTNDKINFESFLKQCYDKVARNKAIKNTSLQQNSLSWIFKIGK